MKNKLQILYLEDDDLDFELVKAKLSSDANFEFDIYMVSELVDFKEKVDSQEFDIVLSDYNLCGFTGLDALNYIKSKHILYPFVLISGAIGDELAVTVMKLGAFDYVLKDSLEKLPMIVARAIETSRQQIEKQRWESMFHTIEKAALAGFFQLSLDGNFSYSNQYLRNIFALYDKSFFKKKWYNIFDKSEIKSIKNYWLKAIQQEGSYTLLKECVLHNGSSKWLNLAILPESNDDRIVGYVGVVFDISQAKKTEQQLEFFKNFDPLTQLPNKSRFEELCKNKLLQTQKSSGNGVLLFLNIDGFKRLNDSLGQKAGDEILVCLANILSKHFMKNAIVSRFDNDTFAVMISKNRDLQEAISLIDRLIAILAKKPINISGSHFYITLTTGVVELQDRKIDTKVAFQHADLALHKAKICARGKYFIYTREISKKANRDIELEHSLYYGIASDEIYLAYQPQVNIKNQNIAGAESLCRWHSKVLGYVSPGELIPLAEKIDMILPLTKYLSKRFFTDVESLLARNSFYPQDIVFSFNLSAKVITDKEFLTFIMNEFKKYKINAGNICFEITETAVMENFKSAKYFLETLKKRGFLFSIDDFGTGQSSLSYLKTLPVSELKIDGSFIKNIDTSRHDRKIAKAIINLAKDLKIRVLAECVENEEQFSLLEKMQCDLVQGFYYSEALALKDFEKYVDAFIADGENNE